MNIDYKELLNGYKNNETVTYIQGAIITYNKGVKAMEKLLEEKEALYNKITTRDNSSYSNIDEYATRIVEINTELSLCNEEIAKSLEVMKKGGLSINNKSEEIVKKAEEIIEAEPKKTDVVIKDVKKAKEKTSKNIKLKNIDKMKTAELIDICKDHKFKGYTAYRSKSDVEKLRQFVKNKLKEERKQAHVDEVIKDEEKAAVVTPIEPKVVDEKAKHIFNAVPNNNPVVKSDEPLFKNIDKYDDELNYKMRAEQIKNAKDATELAALGVSESRIKNYSEVKKEAIKHRVVDIKKVSKETADKIFGMLKSGKAKIAAFGTKTLDFIKDKANVIKTNITEDKEFIAEHAKEASQVVKEKATNATDWAKYQVQDTGRVMADIGGSIGLMATEIPEDIKKASAQVQTTVSQKTEPIRNAVHNTVDKVKSKIDIPQPISLVDENEVKTESKAGQVQKAIEEMTPEQKNLLRETYLKHIKETNENNNSVGGYIDGYPVEGYESNAPAI